MTIPTESPRLEAVSIRDWGWTTTDLRLASPRVRRVGSLTLELRLHKILPTSVGIAHVKVIADSIKMSQPV